MAEGKSGGAGLFAKQVQKRFSRAQEKVRRDARPRRPAPKSLILFYSLIFFHRSAEGVAQRAPLGTHGCS